MPTARFQLEDGRVFRFNVPEGTTATQAAAIGTGIARELAANPQAFEGTLKAPTEPPIPELVRPSVRQTPQAASPLEAAQAATIGELQRFQTGAQEIGQILTGDKRARLKTKLRQRRLERERQERAKQFPKSAFAGQAAPYFAAPGALFSTPLRATATGGVTEWIASGGDPAAAGLGAAAALGGQLAGAGVGRLLSRAGDELTPFQRRAIENWRAMGGKPSPAQETGTRGLQIIESSMESSPMMAGALTKWTSKNQSVANRSAAESIGEAGDVIDDLVLSRAHERIGGVFNEVASEVDRVPIDDVFLQRISDIQDSVTGTIVKKDSAKAIQDTIDRIIEASEADELTGKQLQRFATEARQAAQSALRKRDTDVDLGFAYGDIKSAIDDLAIRHAPTEELAGRLSDARTQYRNLMFLENPGVIRKGGVNPSVLANVLRRQAKGEYLRGRRQGTATPTDRLFATARMGEAVAPAFGRSGTAERLSIQQAAPYLGTGLAGSLMTGDARPLLAGAAAWGAPWAFSRMYHRYPFATGLLGLPHGAVPLGGMLGGRAGAATVWE